MRIRRSFAIIVTTISLLVASIFWLPSQKLAAMINLVLPHGLTISLPERFSASFKQFTLPHFQLNAGSCQLLTLNNLNIAWWEARQISLQKAELDYSCIAALPHSSSTSTDAFDLVQLLAWLPEGYAKIQAFSIVNLPNSFPTHFAELLRQPTQVDFANFQQKLTASLAQSTAQLSATLEKSRLSAQIFYQPTETERHQGALSATLSPNLSELPLDLQIQYQWHLPPEMLTSPELQQGRAELVWHRTENLGHLTLSTDDQSAIYLKLPFQFDGQTLDIAQGQLNWENKAFPLKMFINAKFHPQNQAALFPLETTIKLSVLSQNNKGKGNIVISTQSGLLQKNSLTLPLQITGNVKHQNFILYSSIPLNIEGAFDDIRLRFLQGALLRVTGKERFLTIHDLRFPLAGIQIDKQGIHGRLQAIFRGESPDFKEIEMHLDGYAKNFKGGALTVFQDPINTEGIQDQWQWRFWGKSRLKELQNAFKLAGRGKWHKQLIELSEFEGNISQIKQNGVKIPQIQLTLTEPIQFTYKTFKLNGGIQASAPHILFDYGGELTKPTARLMFNGEVENLHLKGDITAGQLGPLRLFARRELNEKQSQLKGRLYWSEQPASVFQSLFPFRQNWLITGGSVKGETAFSFNDKQGFIAGGHFSVKNGDLSLPHGEIKGLQFSLPYQLKQNEIDIGTKKPLELSADLLNIGLEMQNIRVKIHGHIPYSKRKPLFLRELSLDLLGGNLNVAKFALPQTQVAYLNLNHIRFEEILALAQYHQLALSGRANAILPFWLNGQPCYICSGTIYQTETSHLKFTPEFIQAIQKGGYTEQILSYMVNDSQVNQLNANVNVDEKGDMVLFAQIRSQLAEHQKAKINLNYRHQENLFDLWKLINYGSQFEQNIEHSIYQQLDKHK